MSCFSSFSVSPSRSPQPPTSQDKAVPFCPRGTRRARSTDSSCGVAVSRASHHERVGPGNRLAARSLPACGVQRCRLFRSTRRTFEPRSASHREQVKPASPAPTTTTSYRSIRATSSGRATYRQYVDGSRLLPRPLTLACLCGCSNRQPDEGQSDMLALTRPTEAAVIRYLMTQKREPFSYSAQGPRYHTAQRNSARLRS